MLRVGKKLLINRPIQFFSLQQAPIVSPLLTVLDDNPDTKNMSDNTLLRTPNQIKLMNEIAEKVSTGWIEIIETCRSHRDPANRGVIITPEYSMATFPFSEQQFDSMIDTFHEYLKNIPEPWDFYFASTFVHFTGNGKYFKRLIPENSDQQSPDILNVALLARRVIGLDKKENTTIVQVHYKQITAGNDLLRHYSKRPKLTDLPDELDPNRIIYSHKEGVMIGEICLESHGSVGFNTVAWQILGKKIPIDAVGYHILASDSITASPATSAYPIYVHVDARLPARVMILTDDDQETEVSIQKSFPIRSQNSYIANGIMTIFEPVKLQPARAFVITAVKESDQAESNIDDHSSEIDLKSETNKQQTQNSKRLKL